MTKKLLLVPVITGLFIVSYGQHVYTADYKELRKYANEAKEPAYESFVRYLNGDTLKGSDLKKQHNLLSGKDKLTLDGRKINFDSVSAYQNEDCFRLVRHDTSLNKQKKAEPNIVVSEFVRIFRGKMNLYLDQVDNSRTATSSDIHTRFYVGRGDEIHWVTLESLKKVMQNCPAALAQIDQEFKETPWYKHPKYDINDYRALIRICDTYNKNCN